MKVNYGRVWLFYLIVEGLSSRLQGVTHRKASCIMEAKHAPLYTLKVSMVMIVIYLWCHWYVIQYWDHVFHNMHILDICPSTPMWKERGKEKLRKTRRTWKTRWVKKNKSTFENTVLFQPSLWSLITTPSEVKRFSRLSCVMRAFEEIFGDICKTVKKGLPRPCFISIKLLLVLFRRGRSVLLPFKGMIGIQSVVKFLMVTATHYFHCCCCSIH